MGSFCKDLECTKKSLEISKSLLNEALASEKEKISKLDSNDYIGIYKIKAQNQSFTDSVSKTITDLYAKLKEKYQIKSDSSNFVLYNIGPAIANLLTKVEKEDYRYQVAKYQGKNYYQDHNGIGEIEYNGTCFVVSKKDFNETDNQIVEDVYIGDFYKGKDTLCLATCGFNMPPTICNGKVNWIPRTDKFESYVKFYRNNDQKAVFIPNFPYIYDFIDMAIDKKIAENKKILSITDFDEIIDEFVNKYQNEEQMKLSRGKNDGK